MAAESTTAFDPGASMSAREFESLSELVYREVGIKLSMGKKTMLVNRLHRRLRTLGLETFAEYHDFVSGPEGHESELPFMIDAVSTNKTDFFREPHHFEYLADEALPALAAAAQRTPPIQINVWSAGCSTGQEPYTLAMVIDDYRREHPEVRTSILASDINQEVLATAARAIYPEITVREVPDRYRRRYMMRGKGERQGEYRVVPELRSAIAFRRINLMDRDYGLRKAMHIIFCRNVIIYFDRPTQKALFEHFARVLVPGGYLFIGHSESLQGISDEFEWQGPAIYRKPS
jgi:chemotaxis protein methyltransferase CheR